jgi:hypothetical protein
MNSFERCRKNEANLSYREVTTLLKYDGEKLIWRVSRGCVKAGSTVGGVNSKGYVHVMINGVLFKAHRVIWLLVYKVWPTDQIDHINGNKRNNTIVNLREVSRQENQRNAKLRRDNASGVVGVSFITSQKRWRGYIVVNNEQINSPNYRFKWSAIVWRRQMNKKYQFHENHGLDDEMREIFYG